MSHLESKEVSRKPQERCLVQSRVSTEICVAAAFNIESKDNIVERVLDKKIGV
jgi:hypothetical protein